MYKANICRALLLWGSVSWWVTAITQSRADDRPRQPSVWRYASLSSQIHLCHESVFWCSLGFVLFNKSHIQTVICSPTLLPFILVFITNIFFHFCIITTLIPLFLVIPFPVTPYLMPQFHSQLIQQIPELLAQRGALEELYRGHSRLFATEQLLHDLQTRLRCKEVDFNHIVPGWGR